MDASAENSTVLRRHCPRCGYDVRGLPGGSACPECGETIDVVDYLLNGLRIRDDSRRHQNAFVEWLFLGMSGVIVHLQLPGYAPWIQMALGAAAVALGIRQFRAFKKATAVELRTHGLYEVERNRFRCRWQEVAHIEGDERSLSCSVRYKPDLPPPTIGTMNHEELPAEPFYGLDGFANAQEVRAFVDLANTYVTAARPAAADQVNRIVDDA